MFCMNCGQQLPDGAKFCMSCGTPQGAVSPTNPANSGTNTPLTTQSSNSTDKPSFVPAMCPNCNARLNVDPSLQIAQCGACGTQLIVQDAIKKYNISGTVNLVHSGNVVHSGTVLYQKDYSNEPNLYVSYVSVDPTLGMSLKIVKTSITSILNSGMNTSFKLAPGQYIIKIKFGNLMRVNVNAERRIIIKEDGSPTRVDIGWKGGLFGDYYINVTM